MVYTARELLAKLKVLTLVGQDADGDLEWVGPDEAWEMSRTLEV